MTGRGKRQFRQLQKLILNSLKAQPLTINEISSRAGINWNSTSHQLILLKGMDCIREIFTHRRLRIFELAEKGRKMLKK